MRGKVEVWNRDKCSSGITPAYAGKSSIMPQEHVNNRDHPRVCGEKLSGIVALSFIEGSPPRMRGKGPL